MTIERRLHLIGNTDIEPPRCAVCGGPFANAGCEFCPRVEFWPPKVEAAHDTGILLIFGRKQKEPDDAA